MPGFCCIGTSFRIILKVPVVNVLLMCVWIQSNTVFDYRVANLAFYCNRLYAGQQLCEAARRSVERVKANPFEVISYRGRHKVCSLGQQT